MNKYFLFLLIILYSCGTKTIIDKAIYLKGPIQLKYSLNSSDSVINKGTKIKMSFAIPQNIITADGIIINDIERATFWVHPTAYLIDSSTNNGYKDFSKNFEKGISDKARAAIDLQKSTYCEDTYICKDTGLFWFSIMHDYAPFRFWTKDGKEYVISAIVAFDVSDMHTDMLLRNAPSLEFMISKELSKGIGHYCFKVVP